MLDSLSKNDILNEDLLISLYLENSLHYQIEFKISSCYARFSSRESTIGKKFRI